MKEGRLKIGISACFFHAEPNRPIFTGKTLLQRKWDGDRIRDEYGTLDDGPILNDFLNAARAAQRA